MVRYCCFSQSNKLYSEDTLNIDPHNGEVEPETFVQLKVTLIPGIAPSFYEGEIEVSITWLDGPGRDGKICFNIIVYS